MVWPAYTWPILTILYGVHSEQLLRTYIGLQVSSALRFALLGTFPGLAETVGDLVGDMQHVPLFSWYGTASLH